MEKTYKHICASGKILTVTFTFTDKLRVRSDFRAESLTEEELEEYLPWREGVTASILKDWGGVD